ncbi:MAG: cytochrome C oxidase subunit IV family protein [Chloroflexota bacterium]
MDQQERQVHVISFRTYILVWLALLGLLAATVSVAKGRLLLQYSVLASLLIASVKAILVLAFFMHLKYEGSFMRGALLIAIAALTITISLTFIDVWFR